MYAFFEYQKDIAVPCLLIIRTILLFFTSLSIIFVYAVTQSKGEEEN
jgi:hypothetical protein